MNAPRQDSVPTEADPSADLPTADIPTADIPTADLLRAAVEVALPPDSGPVVLAVSGGRDSMALLFAAARWAPERIAAVATFDHGTGAHATEAASLVVAEARRLGLTVVRERARTLASTELAWREARWGFLRRVARAYQARIATAHTQDDQLETIVMRLLRGAGTRGLAALAAPSPVLRPWLPVRRAEVAAWAHHEQIPHRHDPANGAHRYLRARVRTDLLPALEQARPGFGDSLLQLGEQAAQWRRELDAFVDQLGAAVTPDARAVRIPAPALASMTPDGLTILWPAVCARAGVILDAKGTRALVRFTTNSRRGAQCPVAGGGVVLRHGAGREDWFEVRRGAPAGQVAHWEWTGSAATLPRTIGGWRFQRVAAPDPPDRGAWHFALPAQSEVSLRGWRPGDRIQTVGAPTGRRISRYFADRHIPAVDRSGWPVVLLNETLMAVPGLCPPRWSAGDANGADLYWYRCERECL